MGWPSQGHTRTDAMSNFCISCRPARIPAYPPTHTWCALLLIDRWYDSFSSCRHERVATDLYPEGTALPPTRPRPSLLRRFLVISAMGVAFTTIGFVSAVAPSYRLWDGLLHPPSDAETLKLYTPADPIAAAIEATLQSHPLVLELRAHPEYTEARPHMKIPPHLRIHHLTSGLLTGPGRLVVPPLGFFEAGGRSAVMVFYLGADLCGHPGVVHGGALATIIDEGLARSCFHALPNKIGMTANLSINYRAPIPADSFVVLRATTTKVEGRKAWVQGRLESLPMGNEAPKVFVEASGLFIEPRAAKVCRLVPNQASPSHADGSIANGSSVSSSRSRIRHTACCGTGREIRYVTKQVVLYLDDRQVHSPGCNP